jgi:uncharacterized protein YigE (DUF2233 family)
MKDLQLILNVILFEFIGMVDAKGTCAPWQSFSDISQNLKENNESECIAINTTLSCESC